jgi:hypothetical protein
MRCLIITARWHIASPALLTSSRVHPTRPSLHPGCWVIGKHATHGTSRLLPASLSGVASTQERREAMFILTFSLPLPLQPPARGQSREGHVDDKLGWRRLGPRWRARRRRQLGAARWGGWRGRRGRGLGLVGKSLVVGKHRKPVHAAEALRGKQGRFQARCAAQ